jgi:hypothetical protein
VKLFSFRRLGFQIRGRDAVSRRASNWCEECLRRPSRQAERWGLALFYGRYRAVGVLADFHAIRVVPFLAGALEEGGDNSNFRTLFGMAKIATNTHIRSMHDPVRPSHPQSSFDQAVATLSGTGRHDGVQATWRANIDRLGRNRILLLAATIVAPSHTMAAPLMAEFMVKLGGAKRQDCEPNVAALAFRLWQNYLPYYLGDNCFASLPIREAVLESFAAMNLLAVASATVLRALDKSARFKARRRTLFPAYPNDRHYLADPLANRNAVPEFEKQIWARTHRGREKLELLQRVFLGAAGGHRQRFRLERCQCPVANLR